MKKLFESFSYAERKVKEEDLILPVVLFRNLINFFKMLIIVTELIRAILI